MKNKIGNAVSKESGQLLVEMLIALAVGAFLMLTASIALVSLLRYNFENRGNQSASALASNLMNGIVSLGEGRWHSLFDLGTTSSSHYYLVPLATSSVAVAGDESVFFDDVEAGLVGYWKFDESTGTVAYDSSGSGNNGTLVNAPTRATSSCLAADCLTFNGISSYVTATAMVSPDLYGTVSAWVNGTGQAFEYSTGTFIPGSFSVSIGSSVNGSINTRFVYSDLSYIDHSGITPSAWISGGWNHVVLVRNNGMAQLYVNGTLADSWLLTAGKDLVGSNIFAIGVSRITTTPGNYFSGSLDDVRIYNRALSATEIGLLYKNKPYLRYFYLDNVSRDVVSGDISATGTVSDSSTLLVHANVAWENGRIFSLAQYITRAKENIFTQNNWMGGAGQPGPLTTMPAGYDTSTNITAGQTLSLTTTTASGTLVSSIFDTQVDGGASINGLRWSGALNGGSVQFQFAYSSSSSGPWIFYGPGGSSFQYYTPTNSNIPLAITDINNYRYFRYEIFLNGSSTPVINGVFVGWSP